MGAFTTRLARSVAVGILLSGASVAPAAAATRTWIGPNSGQWSVASNWDEGVAPVDGDDLVFAAPTSSISNNDLDITVNSIAYSVSHAIYCGGDDLGVTAGLTMSAPNVGLQLNCTVQLGGAQTWTVGIFQVSSVELNGFSWTIDNQGLAVVMGILGNGAITKTGAGIMQLGASTGTAPLAINAGTVEALHANALGNSALPEYGTTVAAGASLVVFEEPSGEYLTLQGTGDGNAGALRVEGSNPITFYAPIELTATTHIASAGPVITLWGDVKGPGDLVILDSATVLFGGTQNTLPAIGFAGTGSPVIRGLQPNLFKNVRITLSAGATLDINDGFTEVAGLDGAGTVTLGATAGQIVIKNTLASTFTGTISGVGGSVYKDGPGMLTLGGANTFAIGPIVTAGTLRVTHPEALGLADGTNATATSVFAGATLALDNVAIANAEMIIINGDTGVATLQVMGTNPSSVFGPVVLSQQAAIAGTHGAALTVTGDLTAPSPFSITNTHLIVMNPGGGITGPAMVNADAALTAGADGVFAIYTKVALNGGTFALNGKTIILGELSGNGVVAFGAGGSLHVSPAAPITLAASTTGTGTFQKSGAALTLSGPFAVTGTVTVGYGPLIIAHPLALTPTPLVTVEMGASLRYDVAATVPYQVTYNGTGAAEDAGAVQVGGGNVTFSGSFVPGGFHEAVRVDAPHVLTWAGPIDATTLHVMGSGTAVIASAGNALTLIRIGLTPITNTPAGPTTVKMGVAGALAPLIVQVHDGSTFDLNGFDLTVTNLTGAGTVAIGARKLTIQTGAQFEGVLTGTGTIEADELYLTGASTFSGSLTAPRFANGGTFPGSVHATESTLTLMANSVTGPVRVEPEGILIVAEEDAAGTATSGSVTVPAGASFSASVHNATLLRVNGTVTLAGELNPRLHPLVSTPGDLLTLIDNDGADPIVGVFSNAAEGEIVRIAEVAYRLSYRGGTGNDITLTKLEAIYFLSEGATGAFFDTDLLIANPHDQIASVGVEFYREGGELEGFLYQIPPMSRITIRVDELEGLESATFSTIVRSQNPELNLIVERTMRWDASGYGAHTEKATTGPALKWYFAEGSEGFFRTYLLLANPDFVPSTATVTYLREGGEPALVRTYELEADSRRTIQASDDPELVGRSFGMTVEFTRRGIAERAMYFGDNPTWKGGHESLGETDPSPTWFLAEGATGWGFDTFILLANPNVEPVDVTYTFLSASAPPATIMRTVPGLSRHTVNIEAEGLSLPDGPVATQIAATRPVIAERAQYWPWSADRWTEAHNSFGVTEAGTKWGLAEGRAGGPEHYQTYILLANAGTADARVQLQFLPDEDSTAPQTMTIDVPAQRRVNVLIDPTGGPDDPATRFGTVITSDHPIVVERAMYWDVNREVWAAGTNATATRLP